MPLSISLDADVLQPPTTPSKTSRSDASSTAETPIKNGSNSGASGSDSRPVGVVKVRPRANSRKEPPTLLTDFFRGKQSPARLAAERKHRQSIELVKAELRQEMKSSSVMKIQQPGGVKDRVQNWQKAHRVAMMEGDPDDAATEPTDIAFKGEDEKSVTESDRVRIKFRQKKRITSKPKPPPESLHRGPSTDKETDGERATPPSSPPKKRVVSDEHWKNRCARRSPSRRVPPSASPKGLPSNFVQNSGRNPLVANKVKEWAAKVDVPDTPPPAQSHRSSKSRGESARSEGAKSEAGDSASDITARWVTKKKTRQDDGIRVKAVKPKKLDDDGIGVPPIDSTTDRDDDGIRVRPASGIAQTNVTWDNHIRGSRPRSKTTSGSGRPSSPSIGSRVSQDATNLSQQTDSKTNESGSKPRASERPGSTLDTPTKGKRFPRQMPKKLHSDLSKLIDESSCLSEERPNLSSLGNIASDLAPSLANKSIADISGDIPFGHSAFSELDLTIEGQPRSRPKRTKVDRSTSLKSMPKVFKKVVEESKKIIHEMNEPPRHQVANNPPSIEKWLNNTVDPFVDSKPATEKGSRSAEPTDEKSEQSPQEMAKPRRRSSHGTKILQQSSSNELDKEEKMALDESAVDGAENTSTPDSAKGTATTPTSAGLKRSRATRSNPSPLKVGSGKRQLLGVLKEAFQGESSPHPVRPKSYQGSEQRKFSHVEDVPPPLQIRKSMPPSSATEAKNSTQRSGDEESLNFKLAAPRFRPPTRGDHELSTILSEESYSAVDSDLSSDVTQSTLTQSTVLTKDSEISKTQKNHAPALKRRLTKHSDLVSVLSLPDDSTIPNTMKSNRSRPSLCKHRSPFDDATAQELLREFIDDENIYGRELKTLVDGVVPVLLSHVVNGTNVTELFGPSSLGKIPDSVSKSVVNMGVALEKLKSAHKKAPTSDIRKMANWAHGVVPMYNSYLSAWRLGFDDVVVNLAPAADGMNDDESLLAALPRNEQGDVVNDHGERVAVAYLLKRPLIRVKQLAKLIKCVDTLVATTDTRELLRDFENLQDKARRRYKEEAARIVDEEAICTDTSRCRDLGTLGSSPAVTIDPTRQVSAKDVFSLSLSHSNSQRLDCQVELVHRDNQKDTSDEGDLLIRETGEGGRSYLLFPPIAMTEISARTGDSHFEMVVMIRGTSQDRTWREFITLTADNEDQILDWLDILPLLPVPPLEIGPVASGQSQEPTTPTTSSQRREPLIATPSQGSPEMSPRSPIAKDVSASGSTSAPANKNSPIRYRQRAPTMDHIPSPITPSVPNSADPGKTPIKEVHQEASVPEGRGRPLKESMRPDFSQFQAKQQEGQPPNTTPYRDDGAPPPPVHRTLSTSPKTGAGGIHKSAPSLTPPTDTHSSDRLKRRTSSPLKHEYLPSDQSSASEAYSTEESDPDSSDDELESIDIPETELGISIKSDAQFSQTHAAPRFMLESDCSLTPSNSASQAGLHGFKNVPDDQVSWFMARISRWSDKGAWKDIMSDPCSIVVRDGLIEAYALRTATGSSDTNPPILALDLTPLVLIRQSTAVDLEIRSSVQSHSRLYQSHNGGNFRFRCFAAPDCYNLYMSVHQARLNNQKFIQLENERRFKNFGERQASENDGDTSSRRRSWFGRKESYRSSVRAPSRSHDGASTTPSSTPSASSFLKRLTVNGNLSFNIARSSIDRRPRASSGENSLYTSGSSSASGTPLRSPSVSVDNSGHHSINVATESIRVRLHLLVASAKWEDYGNCSLQIRRPPPGWRQALRANHGLEKRITVTTLPRKETDEPKIVLDAVLGSGCFSSMGSRGIVCGVWEEVKNGDGVVGMAPETGATGGNIKKWCFQFGNAAEANAVLRLVHQEVLRA
ncbi:hypothetical protein C2857_004508 [Epichloe festucae Fl1]|uniref:SRm160/300 splicing coactivator n=1 Tax=Epichloe festucae (strain Fl1) TaxID=877507 RepID=A0A7S9PS77_EPIFF|nr:hypothetical protein C2857_004508 [Epichloe festucae Fl1]